jgi:hypothetical protein
MRYHDVPGKGEARRQQVLVPDIYINDETGRHEQNLTYLEAPVQFEAALARPAGHRRCHDSTAMHFLIAFCFSYATIDRTESECFSLVNE